MMIMMTLSVTVETVLHFVKYSKNELCVKMPGYAAHISVTKVEYPYVMQNFAAV